MIFSSPDPAVDPGLAAILLCLQRSSYALEAELIGTDRLPPLHEDVHGLCAWRGSWVLAWDRTDLVGAIAWTTYPDRLDIEKVMVSPAAMRRGLGSALVEQAIETAARRAVTVATGRDNTPAVCLYGKHGFEPESDDQVPPGVWITRFRREP